jgi:hypothetical protein
MPGTLGGVGNGEAATGTASVPIAVLKESLPLSRRTAITRIDGIGNRFPHLVARLVVGRKTRRDDINLPAMADRYGFVQVILILPAPLARRPGAAPVLRQAGMRRPQLPLSG